MVQIINNQNLDKLLLHSLAKLEVKENYYTNVHFTLIFKSYTDVKLIIKKNNKKYIFVKKINEKEWKNEVSNIKIFDIFDEKIWIDRVNLWIEDKIQNVETTLISN